MTTFSFESLGISKEDLHTAGGGRGQFAGIRLGLFRRHSGEVMVCEISPAI